MLHLVIRCQLTSICQGERQKCTNELSTSKGFLKVDALRHFAAQDPPYPETDFHVADRHLQPSYALPPWLGDFDDSSQAL